MAVSYPLYLDVPMMVSVLAAQSEGVSNDGWLQSLGIDLDGRIGTTAESTAHNVVAQRHTISSLFHQLNEQLSDQIVAIDHPDQLANAQEGQFVLLSGALTRNPIYEFLTVMERLFALAANTIPEAEPTVDIPEETRQVFSALTAELNDSPMVSATMRTNNGTAAVLSLQKAYLRHMSLDDLRFGRVAVLGKAVGRISETETYSLLTQSLVGHMVSDAFNDALQGLLSINPGETFPISTEVSGPGLFVVPLAIYI